MDEMGLLADNAALCVPLCASLCPLTLWNQLLLPLFMLSPGETDGGSEGWMDGEVEGGMDG